MNKILLVTIMMGLSQSMIGQVSISVDVQGPTSETSCDGVITIEAFGVGNVNGVSSYSPQAPTDFPSSVNNISLDGLCESQEFNAVFEIENDSCVRIIVGSLGGPFWSSSLSVLEDIEFEILFTLPSSEFSTDGGIEVISNDIPSEEIFYYPYSATEAAFILVMNIEDTLGTGNSIDSLVSGNYVIRLYEPTINKFFGIGIVLESVGNAGCNDSLSIVPHVQPDYGFGGCSGSVEIIPWGTVGPYSFEHSPSGATEAIADSLCSGLHSVIVTDQANNTATAEYIIPSTDLIINSVDWPFDPDLDTLFAQATNYCDLDFTQPIDSVFIGECTIIDSVTCSALWFFFQDGEMFTIVQPYTYETPLEFVFTLGVYCLNGRSELGYYFFVDDFNLENAGHVGIANDPISKFSINPNPNSGQFSVTSDIDVERIDVLDITGQLVGSYSSANGMNTEIDITDQPSGMYLLKIISDNRFGLRKIIKR